jgi:hypothetical protein
MRSTKENPRRRLRGGLCRPKVLVGLLLLLAVVLWSVHRMVDRCYRSLLGWGPKYNQRLPLPHAALEQAAAGASWSAVLSKLVSSDCARHVIVDARYGLGNRLRAVASAMSVAAATGRPLLVIWVPDGHCNCSLRMLLASPLPFALLEVDLPVSSLPVESFQAFNYMPGETGSVKREWVRVDSSRHLYVRTAYRIAHERGEWPFAARKLRELQPRASLVSDLVADSSMVGLHVRGVVDAISNYGDNGTAALAEWREKGSWPHFVERMRGEPSWRRFYLAADDAKAFDGLNAAFPGRIVTNAEGLARCRRGRCDLDRGCAAMGTALTDILNLARTGRILGSGYSSFSEVARYYGAADSLGTELPFEAAGIDF